MGFIDLEEAYDRVPTRVFVILQALTYNCLTTRESTLVSIHETVVTVYMRALSRCHAISQLQQNSYNSRSIEPIWKLRMFM
ncbi:hypothetical protein RGQ29_031500 [Quercus rubra]|uniref:Uncharacterized protein n=1 Tax=Quercus rubra TaxID=3512 RepID=A0AAN7IFQ8_QUERU|nr:hypothetical protein RGQ29_031500 [Quercus rubra]